MQERPKKEFHALFLPWHRWLKAWYTRSTASSQNTLQIIGNAARKITAVPLSSLMDIYLSCLTHRAMRTPSTSHTPSFASCPQGEGAGVSGPGDSQSVPLDRNLTQNNTEGLLHFICICCHYHLIPDTALLLDFKKTVFIFLILLFLFFLFCFLGNRGREKSIKINKNLWIFHFWMISERAVKQQKSLFSSLKLL